MASPEQRWNAVLDNLDREARRAEVNPADAALALTDAPAWELPTDIGQMPASLEGRARRILARLERARIKTEAARADMRAQLDAIGQMPESAQSSTPVFVDVSA